MTDFVDDYLEHLQKERDVSPNTVAAYLFDKRPLIEEISGRSSTF